MKILPGYTTSRIILVTRIAEYGTMRISLSWCWETAEMLVAWRQPAGIEKIHSYLETRPESASCHCLTPARADLDVDVAQYIPMRYFRPASSLPNCASVIRDVRYATAWRDSSGCARNSGGLSYSKLLE